MNDTPNLTVSALIGQPHFHCPPIEAGDPSQLPDSTPGQQLTYENPVTDNGIRATWAADAVKAYAKRTGILTGEPVDTAIRDLLSDLMHLVDGLRQTGSLDDFYPDWQSMLESSTRRYDEEIRGEV